MSPGCPLLRSPIDLNVKGQGHNALETDNGLRCIIAFSLHNLHEYSYKNSPKFEVVFYLFWFQKVVKGQDHITLKTENRLCCIIAFPWHLYIIMKLHTKTPSESMMCPVDFGVKSTNVKRKRRISDPVLWQKAPAPTEKSRRQRDNTKTQQKIRLTHTDRLSLSDDSHQTGVVKPVNGI